MVLNTRQILDLLPHRFPFLLVDKVIERHGPTEPSSRAGQRIVALKNVTVNEPFFPGHFPGLPIMPGVLQLEALAQASGLAFLRPGDPEYDFFIASVQEVRFRRPVEPGDTLYLHAEIVKDRGSMIQVKTRAVVDGKDVCEALILAKVELRSKRDPS